MGIRRFSRVRIDKGEVTAQGFLRAPAFLTRTGVFKYRKADGTIIRELRHPDDVFHPASIESLRMAPLTNDHPADFVTPENVKELSVGWISDTINQDGKFIAANALVSDKEAIDRVNMGKVELSCGYLADLVQEKGVFDGEPYDYRQKNIRYNHVAIVDRGRAGPQVRLRLDAEDAESVTDESTEKEKPQVYKIKIDGKEVEVSKEVFDAWEANEKTKGELEKELKQSKADKADSDSKAKTAKEEADKALARADSAEQKLKEHKDATDPKLIETAVSERIKIQDTASAVLGSEAKFDGKSNLEIMKEVLAKAAPKTDLKDKSEVYIRARFDAIAEESEGRENRRTQFSTRKKEDERKDEEFDSDAARKKSLDDARDLWKQPLAANKK